MPTSTACDNCGKTYQVPEATIGKRVKCKNCGSAFVAVAKMPAQVSPSTRPVATAKTPMQLSSSPRPAPVASKTPTRPAAPAPVPKPAPKVKASPPPAPVEDEGEYGFKDDPDDWSKLEAAADAPVTVAPQVAIQPAGVRATANIGKSLGAAGEFLSRFSAGTITRMSAVILAVLIILLGLVVPEARLFGGLFFIVAAVLYFFTALIVGIVADFRSSGEPISAGAIVLLVLSILLSVLARRMVLLYRFGSRTRFSPLGRVLKIFLNSAFIFSMAIVIPLVSGFLRPMHRSPFSMPTSPTRNTSQIPKPTGPGAMSTDLKAHANIQQLGMLLEMYRGKHGKFPDTLNDLEFTGWPKDHFVSPFDDSEGLDAYVYLPKNADGDESKVVIYDAAQLHETNTAYALTMSKSHSTGIQPMTEAELQKNGVGAN